MSEPTAAQMNPHTARPRLLSATAEAAALAALLLLAAIAAEALARAAQARLLGLPPGALDAPDRLLQLARLPGIAATALLGPLSPATWFSPGWLLLLLAAWATWRFGLCTCQGGDGWRDWTLLELALAALLVGALAVAVSQAAAPCLQPVGLLAAGPAERLELLASEPGSLALRAGAGATWLLILRGGAVGLGLLGVVLWLFLVELVWLRAVWLAVETTLGPTACRLARLALVAVGLHGLALIAQLVGLVGYRPLVPLVEPQGEGGSARAWLGRAEAVGYHLDLPGGGLVAAGDGVVGRHQPAIDLLSATTAGALRTANRLPAELTGAWLPSADLRGARLVGLGLRGAVLRGADLRGADLSGCDLRRADLRGADLRGANLTDARLNGARLAGARQEERELPPSEDAGEATEPEPIEPPDDDGDSDGESDDWADDGPADEPTAEADADGIGDGPSADTPHSKPSAPAAKPVEPTPAPVEDEAPLLDDTGEEVEEIDWSTGLHGDG